MSNPVPQHDANLPYCGHCGYALTGLTESARCPECGKPLVEVLMRRSFMGRGSRRYTSPRKLLGLPLVSIAMGPGQGERMGRAVGFIAIGDYARGVIAIGSFSVGVFSFGGFSAGLFSFGGFSLGAVVALGGFAGGLIAAGGFAIGGWTIGGMCLYLIRAWGGHAVPLLP